MERLLERARAYLNALEAEREAAQALSEQKAAEAKLIKARQEGFQAAMELLGSASSAGTAISGKNNSVDSSGLGEREAEPQEPHRRHGRRPIRGLILRELSFSGQPMTAAQIAKAIDYITERTGTALERMEKDGEVVRGEGGRWAIGASDVSQINGHALTASDRKLPAQA